MSYEEIAHRIRWDVESVKHYLRDCYLMIGAQCETTIRGAYLTNW